jgi:4-diphosphocytidyl-2-C-methyl-D-erythritol kinase
VTDPAGRLAPVVRTAPAKLNLTLAVLGRRADGFHNLHSVIVPLGLADRLSVAVAAAGPDTLRVEGSAAGAIGPTEDNLVLRAIAATRTAVGRSASTPPLAARLEKRIPVAAGLGGGSSDAAAAIDAALDAWSADLDPERCLDVAAGLGSDVPFFLADGPALVQGRGERVMPLRGIRGDPPGVLLLTPAVPVPTGSVFAALAAGGPAAPPSPGATRITSAHLAGELVGGLRAADLAQRAGILSTANDLAAAASLVAPGLKELRWSLARLLGRPVGLSGSGPTLWAIYPSADEASEAASVVAAALDEGRLTSPGSGRPFVAATVIISRGAGEESPP